MPVYLWEDPDNTTDRLMGEYDRKQSPNRFLFLGGERVAPNPGVPIIEFEIGVERIRKLDNLANTSGSPIISPRLAEILTDFAPDDIQLFDVLLKATDGEITDYKLLNLTRTVQGVDRERSIIKFYYESGGIGGFKILYCTEGCLGPHHLARLEEAHSQILVSQELKDHLKRCKVKGIKICKPEDWYADILSDAYLEKIGYRNGR